MGELTDIEVFGDNLFVAGYFSTVNGISKNNVVKLNIDGSIDNTFDIGAGTGANDFIAALTIQSNGKILLDGSIISFNGIENFHKLIRLNTDGSIDTGFSSPSVGVTSKMVVTSDGIYGCGIFQATMTDLNYRFFKLNLDGSLASDFEPIHIQPLDFFHIPMAVLDDGILIGSQSDGGNPLGLDKVDFSGNYAKNFAPEISCIGIARFGQLLEGKLLIGGDFIRIDGYKTNGLARINYDGSVDESFQLKENKGVVTQIEVLKDNTVLVLTPSVFFKTDSHGNLLPDFNWISGTDDLYQVDKFKVLNNGTIIAAGGNILLRLLDDGAVDNTFTLPIQGGDVGSTAFDFDLQGDKIIYGSIFSTLEGVPVNRIARLLNDGTVDNTFNIGSGINDPAGDGFISLVKVLNNNEILVGGVFKSFNGVSLSRSLVKLSPNGTMDITFNQNQLLSNGIANATFMSNTVLQIGSVLFINNFYSMYVINTDGSDSNFTFPGNIQYINNIVNSSSSIEGRVQDDENYLYTIGSFQTSTSGSPSAILKMTLDKNSTPSAPGVVAGTEKSLDKSVRIYPQPVTDFLTVNTGTGNFHAEVYDTSGKNYYENNFSANNGSFLIDMKNVNPGLYLLKITSASGESAVKKFVKKP